MPTGKNILRESGKPLFFEVPKPELTGLKIPRLRDGREQAVRVAVRSLSGMQKEALVYSARSGRLWRLSSDEGKYLNGHNEGPCPLFFLSTGMISSYMNEITALARIRDIELRSIRLVQDNFYTMEGSMPSGTMTGGARNIELEAEILSPSNKSALTSLVNDGVAASPLNGLMRGVNESLFTLTHNGREIPLGKAKSLQLPAEADIGAGFDNIEVEAGGWSGLVVRGDMTPVNEHTKTMEGGSLAAEQSRILHIRSFCTLEANGLKRITHHHYNPHGNIFTMYSDESPEAGGKGLAPDAVSYISAGFGFCFMTQFGRFAKIMKVAINDYRIIQDTYFSLAGASGETGQPGEADSIETHVYLETGEDDDLARKCLDMAEQTCFLHAFCRTDLKARVKVKEPATQ